MEVPLWKQPDVLDLVRVIALPAALGLVAILVFFGLVRPGMKAMIAAAPPRPAPQTGSNLVAVEDGATALPALPPPAANERLEEARRIARDNPAAVAGILRGWVEGEQPVPVAR